MNQISEIEIKDVKNLKYYAEKAKNEINNNNYLHKLNEIYTNYIKEIKNLLFDRENIELKINNLNNNIKNNIEKTKNELQKLKNKYDTYYIKCTDELEMDRPDLNQAKIDQFTLNYSLQEKDDIIYKLKKSVNISKEYNVFRENKRDNYIDKKERNTLFKKIADDLQLSLLLQAKKTNKLSENNKKKKQRIIDLKDKINKLNELILLLKKETKCSKQHNQNSNNQNRTLDETPSTNMELYSKSQKITQLKNKSCKSNEKFLFFPTSKKFEEDSNINNKDNQKMNSNKITLAILSTKIRDSFPTIKSMSVNPVLNDCIQNYEINEINENNKNLNDEDTKNLNEIKNYDISLNKALSAENIKTKKIKKQKKNKIIQTFLNLEDLFDVSDDENEKEELLIDSELHSDDDTILENKIKAEKTIYKTYKDKIEKEIPKINLSLIEFNKLKVYQEVDLYSLQRRNYKGANLEDNIRILSRKIKRLKKKENLNYRKVKAMKKYIDDLKNKYIMYKRIRTKSSAFNSEVKYISNNEIVDINNFINQDDSGDDVGSDYLNEDDEITENCN